MSDTIPKKKINELPVSTTVNDSDIMITQTAESTPKTNQISISTLFSKVKTFLLNNTPFTYISSLKNDAQTQLDELFNGKDTASTQISGLTNTVNQLNKNKANSNHTHTWATITDKPTAFIPSAHNQDWGTITGKPSTYTPSSHTHDDRYFTETEINNKMSKMFKTVSVSGASVSLAPGEARALSIPYTTPNGYSPIGIVGFYTGEVPIRTIRVVAGRMDVINVGTQIVQFTPTITVLFCKTGLI